jgi:hypothetical protein
MASDIRTGRSSGVHAGTRSALRVPIELWIALVFMVVAFSAGLTIGVLARSTDTAPVVGVGQTSTGIPGQSVVAPPLSQDQLQQGLPSGHPSIGGSGQSPALGTKGSDSTGKGGKGSNTDGSGNGSNP